MATEAPPYVSLLDRLRGLGKTLLEGANESGMIPYAEIAPILTALVHYIEHGDELLDASAAGYGETESILTPDRPEGWVPPGHMVDPRDAEIERLKAALAQKNQRQPDAKDRELAQLRAQAQDAAVANEGEVQAFEDWREQQRRDAEAAGLPTSTVLPEGAADIDVKSEPVPEPEKKGKGDK